MTFASHEGVLGRIRQKTINYPLVISGKWGEEDKMCPPSENHRTSANEAEKMFPLAPVNHFCE